MAAKFVAIALLLIACSYASPLRVATVYYDSPLIVVPILVQELGASLAQIEPIHALNDNPELAGEPTSSHDVEKRSAEETDDLDDDDDLETAAGTNVLRPLFVYRQQVAYRQRVRDAIRRGRRI